MIENVGTALVALGVSRGGCGGGSPGIVFSVNTTGLWQLADNTAIKNPVASEKVSIVVGTWYTLTLVALEDHPVAYINGNLVGRCELSVSSHSGWAAIGSSWE